MNIKKEIQIIKELLNLTQSELAKELEVSFETVNRWENEKHEIEKENINKIYTFAYKKGIYLNLIYEQLYKENENDYIKILFHGCKNEVFFPIDLSYSKKNNDFGIGFYLGENFKQASTYIANSSSTNVYIFELNMNNLIVKKFNLSKEWLIAIAYYRGWLEKYKDHTLIINIVNQVEKSDIIIAPIADNKMFDIISEFVRGEITDLQCEHALAATNLGMQYVLRTNKSINQTKLLELCYVSKIEKEKCIKERLDMSLLSQNKVKVARIEYRGKGQYIDELLKCES